MVLRAHRPPGPDAFAAVVDGSGWGGTAARSAPRRNRAPATAGRRHRVEKEMKTSKKLDGTDLVGEIERSGLDLDLDDAGMALHDGGVVDNNNYYCYHGSEPEMAAVDELQALNTALCFLVSINADARVVRSYVCRYPGSLLLEGVAAAGTASPSQNGASPTSSASSILRSQIRTCTCFSPLCRQNRSSVRRVLDRGFEHYAALSLIREPRDGGGDRGVDPTIQTTTRARTKTNAWAPVWDAPFWEGPVSPVAVDVATVEGYGGWADDGDDEDPPEVDGSDDGDEGPAPPMPSLGSGTAYGARMQELERAVRIGRRNELRLRHMILEATVRVRDLDGHLARCRNDAAADASAERADCPPPAAETTLAAAGFGTSGSTRSPSGKAIWALCGQRRPPVAPGSRLPAHHHHHHHEPPASLREIRARCSAAEYRLRMAQLGLASLEREHEEQIRRIRSARRVQFGLLKRAFEGCRRHVCLTSDTPAVL